MRTSSFPTILEFLICLFFELLHAVGVVILFFVALPGIIKSECLKLTESLTESLPNSLSESMTDSLTEGLTH